MSGEITIVDAAVVKAEVVEYIGSVVEDARTLSVSITDDVTCEKAIALGALVKDKTKWLKGRRAAVYEPLKTATETVRLEYDNPLKLADQIEKTLAAAVITYKQKKRDEEKKRQLELEAKAKQEREEAARKEREAAAERDRIIRERQEAEQKKREQEAAERKAAEDKAAAEKKAAEDKAKAEADERARQLKEEEDRRLANAQKAHDEGLAERSEQLLDKQMPVAPIPAPLPSAADIAAKAEEKRKADEAAAAEEKRKADAKAAEDKKRQEEADYLKRLDDEAALAKSKAAETDAAASQQVTVTRPEERMRTSIRWRYDLPNVEAVKKLCRAISEGRAPVEYIGYDPLEPQKFRAAAIQKDVTRMKDQFDGDAIGIRTWPEEGATFKAE